eukprot:m.236184 g.236184  ORF g.236184 m.236184 type:complete len:1287 (+) comp33678_c0_seq1:280-4140(+)
MYACVILGILLHASHACEFDCQRASGLCGGEVKYIEQSFEYLVANTDAQIETSPPQHTLDLSNRQITSIAPLGLSCYNLQGASEKDADIFEVFNAGRTQAILLDHNLFTTVPPMGLFNGTRTVSLRNNQISLLAASVFAGHIGHGNLNVILSSNAITSVEVGILSGFKGASLDVQVQLNTITSLSSHTFSDFKGERLSINLQNNNLSALAAYTFSGTTATEMNVFLQNNLLETVVKETFAMFNGSQLGVFCGNNQITSLEQETFGGFSQSVLGVDLSNNQVSSFLDGTFSNFSGHTLNVMLNENNFTTLSSGKFNDFAGEKFQLYLENNEITSCSPGAFSMAKIPYNNISIFLQNNSIASLQPSQFTGFMGTTLSVRLQHNNISMLPRNVFDDFSGNELDVFMQYNHLTILRNRTFSSFGGKFLVVYLNNNNLQLVEPGAIAGFEQYLDLYLNDNQIVALSAASFEGFEGKDLNLEIKNNNIANMDSVFDGFDASARCVINLSNNNLDGYSLKRALNSFTSGATTLTIILTHNNVTIIPEDLLAEVASFSATFATITLNISYNPISTITPTSFSFSEDFGFLAFVFVDMSHSTDIITFPDTIELPSGYFWDDKTGGSLTLNFDSTNIDLGIINAFNGVEGPEFLKLVLSNNGYEYLPSDVYLTSKVNALDLSHNKITAIAADAFSYSLLLTSMTLAHNELTVLQAGVMVNLPFVVLNAVDNQIWAITETGNHFTKVTDAEDNVLVCDSYGPELDGCRCQNNLTYSTHCGYGRCLETLSGCGAESLIYNKNDCSHAPNSACLRQCPDVHDYYDVVKQFCITATNCTTAFPNSDKKGGDTFTKAYEVRNSSATSDRLCSICSTCPSDYHTVPCTPTSNAQCTQTLSGAAIAAIVLVAILLVASGLVGWIYQQHRRRLTAVDLATMKEKLKDWEVPDRAAMDELIDRAAKGDSAASRELEEIEAKSQMMLQDATNIVKPDEVAYNLVWANCLQLFGAESRDALDTTVNAIKAKMGGDATKLHQPLFNMVAVRNAQYLIELERTFDQHTGPLERNLNRIASKYDVTCASGPSKKQERIFQKAEQSYSWDLSRITDYRRFSLVCPNFEVIENVLKDIAQITKCVRIKNRFSKLNKNATETAGYRDLQLCVEDHELIFEVQLHLAPIYDKKNDRAAACDASGMSGHDRYVQFRNVKEKLRLPAAALTKPVVQVTGLAKAVRAFQMKRASSRGATKVRQQSSTFSFDFFGVATSNSRSDTVTSNDFDLRENLLPVPITTEKNKPSVLNETTLV